LHIKESRAHVRFSDDQTYVENYDNRHSNANIRIINPKVSHRTKTSRVSVIPQSHVSRSQLHSVIPEVSVYRGMSINEDHQVPIPNQQVLFHKMNVGTRGNSRMSSSSNQQVKFIEVEPEDGFYH
jgi:hypothetical protein